MRLLMGSKICHPELCIAYSSALSGRQEARIEQVKAHWSGKLRKYEIFFLQFARTNRIFPMHAVA